MIQAEVNKFFANKSNPPQRIRIGGERIAVSNLPKPLQDKIKERLAEKDPILRLGNKGILPGIKIDGKQVTRDNIHEFEINSKPKVEPKLETIVDIPINSDSLKVPQVAIGTPVVKEKYIPKVTTPVKVKKVKK